MIIRSLILLFAISYTICLYGQRQQDPNKSGVLSIQETASVDAFTRDTFAQIQKKLIQKAIQELEMEKGSPLTSEESARVLPFIEGFDLLDMLLGEDTSLISLDYDSIQITKHIKRGGTDLPRFDVFMRGSNIYTSNLILSNGIVVPNVEKIEFTDSLFTVTIDTLQKQRILNLPCYKVTIREKENSEYNQPVEAGVFNFGESIWEMWVTDKINIPLYIVFDNLKIQTITALPLITKYYESNLPGLVKEFIVQELNTR